MAAKGIRAAVTTWMRHDHNACLAHQLWIGPGADTPGNQAAISSLPEVASAQRQHTQLIHRHGHHPVQEAFHRARLVTSDWGDDPHSPVFRRWISRHARLGSNSTLTRLAAFYLILYPEAVALASVFVLPRWQQLALSPDRADNYHRFFHELSARTLQAISTRAQPEGEPGSPLGQRIISLRAELRLRACLKDPDDPTMTWRLRPYVLPPETHDAAWQ